jgi:hypothetical protein
MKGDAKPAKKPAMEIAYARLDVDVVDRLDALAALLAPLGSKASRSVAVRAVILTGLPVLEAQLVKGGSK